MTLRLGRYLTWRTVGVALLYSLPALFWVGRPLRPDGVLGIYRISATFILAFLFFAGNHVYWVKLFVPRIYRLNPKLQKETGARIVNDKFGRDWRPDRERQVRARWGALGAGSRLETRVSASAPLSGAHRSCLGHLCLHGMHHVTGLPSGILGYDLGRTILFPLRVEF
jgi:hypothetical protein